MVEQTPDVELTAVTPGVRRADLHCHSWASNRAAESTLRAIKCPESYSPPAELYQQAKRRAMDFVTITDHDSLDGVLTITDRPDVLVGEELTCWFPEDNCKMHVLVFGITRQDHDALQAMARDIYRVADYIEQHRIAHSVAHPIYRQNDKLEKWHVERLLLLFKGFECLNGAHSSLHQDAFEPLLDGINRSEIARLSIRHNLAPRWPEPWKKARTAGSDDHGLLNIGRTYTLFPPGTNTPADVLECIRSGRCAPGGEAGSSAKLAHTFYAVGIRYFGTAMLKDRPANLPAAMMQILAGQRRKPSNLQMAALFAGHAARDLWKRIKSPFAPSTEGTGLIKSLFTKSARKNLKAHGPMWAALEQGLPPLGEHEDFFSLVSQINRDVTQGIAESVRKSIGDSEFTRLFDATSSILTQQFVLFPYYFAFFHQNKERHLLRQITGQKQGKTDGSPLKVALFTDTLDETNGVARFIRDMAAQAATSGKSLTVHTCSPRDVVDEPWRKNFTPLLAYPMPFYPQLNLTLPPLLEILDWADKQQFDAVHVSTPGLMGLCGWVVARMLRVPLLMTYHTDFPAYALSFTKDYRVGNAVSDAMRWFYGQSNATFTRSTAYRTDLLDMGLSEDRLCSIPPGVNTTTFTPMRRDPGIWQRLGIKEPRRVMYCGRVSEEKNLALLAEAFQRLCRIRNDTALVIAGDGPYLDTFKRTMAGFPAYFLGRQNDAVLGPLYAGADLFAFPSRTDTLGQVVMEAQCSGCPTLVTNEGGPRELVVEGVTGYVLPATNVDRWVEAMAELLADEPRRAAMSQAAMDRSHLFSIKASFSRFWERHAQAAEGPVSDLELAHSYPRFFARVHE